MECHDSALSSPVPPHSPNQDKGMLENISWYIYYYNTAYQMISSAYLKFSKPNVKRVEIKGLQMCDMAKYLEYGALDDWPKHTNGTKNPKFKDYLKKSDVWHGHKFR